MIGTYHSVTQACRKLNLKPHVLRYWEKEFKIGVKRNSAGRRIYSDEQVEKLRLIKHLLHREKMTVKGARRQLARMRSQPATLFASEDHRQSLLWLKKELIALRGLLETGDPPGPGTRHEGQEGTGKTPKANRRR